MQWNPVFCLGMKSCRSDSAHWFFIRLASEEEKRLLLIETSSSSAASCSFPISIVMEFQAARSQFSGANGTKSDARTRHYRQ